MTIESVPTRAADRLVAPIPGVGEGPTVPGPQIATRDFGTYEPPECRHERTYDDSTWTSAMTRCADCGHVIDQDET